MATDLIGTGETFTTPALWEADIPGTLTEQRIGELKNEEFTNGGYVCDIDGHTTTSSFDIILRCATGASFNENANKLTNALRYNASNGAGLRCTGGSGVAALRVNATRHVTIQGVQCATTGGTYAQEAIKVVNSNAGTVVKQCIAEVSSGGTGARAMRLEVAEAQNCLIVSRLTNASHGLAVVGASVVNSCTIVRPDDLDASTSFGVATSYASDTVMTNCAVYGFNAFKSGAISASSNYNSTDNAAASGGANDQVGQTYADQFENVNDATRDFRAKAGADLLNSGNTDLTVDIIGTSRPQGAADDIGAWELVETPAGGANNPGWGRLIALERRRLVRI